MVSLAIVQAEKVEVGAIAPDAATARSAQNTPQYTSFEADAPISFKLATAYREYNEKQGVRTKSDVHHARIRLC